MFTGIQTFKFSVMARFTDTGAILGHLSHFHSGEYTWVNPAEQRSPNQRAPVFSPPITLRYSVSSAVPLQKKKKKLSRDATYRKQFIFKPEMEFPISVYSLLHILELVRRYHGIWFEDFLHTCLAEVWFVYRVSAKKIFKKYKNSSLFK